jgi:hypothetical protein
MNARQPQRPTKQNARRCGRWQGKGVQALSSRIPPVRAVAVAGNLYKSHAYLQFAIVGKHAPAGQPCLHAAVGNMAITLKKPHGRKSKEST